MAWIESHQALEKHPKVLRLSRAASWSVPETIGKLHIFWWWCLNYATDGRLKKHGNDVIANVFGITTDCDQFVTTLNEIGFVDFEPEIRVHDWWDYAGKFLQIRYKRTPKTWKEIKRFYGYSVYRNSSRTVQGLSDENNHKPNQPNLTNLTRPTRPNLLGVRRKLLTEFALTEEVHTWAMRELRIVIPEDVVEEFKSYWLDLPDKKLRTNWGATFKKHLRALVGRGVLKPQPALTAVPQAKCCGVRGEPCDAYAALGSRYCQPHKDKIAAFLKQQQVTG